MTYDAQDLFDYGQENGVVLDVSEIMEAMSKFPMDIMDAFDWCCLSDCDMEFSEQEKMDMILSRPATKEELESF